VDAVVDATMARIDELVAARGENAETIALTGDLLED
jgi:hypothetical protein